MTAAFILLVLERCYLSQDGHRVCIFKPVPTVVCFRHDDRPIECQMVPYNPRRSV